MDWIGLDWIGVVWFWRKDEADRGKGKRERGRMVAGARGMWEWEREWELF